MTLITVVSINCYFLSYALENKNTKGDITHHIMKLCLQPTAPISNMVHLSHHQSQWSYFLSHKAVTSVFIFCPISLSQSCILLKIFQDLQDPWPFTSHYSSYSSNSMKNLKPQLTQRLRVHVIMFRKIVKIVKK